MTLSEEIRKWLRYFKKMKRNDVPSLKVWLFTHEQMHSTANKRKSDMKVIYVTEICNTKENVPKEVSIDIKSLKTTCM